MTPYLNLYGHTESSQSHDVPRNASSNKVEGKSMPIAIVGMGFRGPADATNTENLWKMIAEGREGRSEIPKDRWNNKAFYHPNSARNGTVSLMRPFAEFRNELNDQRRSIMLRQATS